MLPSNHYGERPGRMGVDMVQGIVKKVKDAWRRSKVVTLLLRNVKEAFPSAMISRVVHNMRMAGVPREHIGCNTDSLGAPHDWSLMIMSQSLSR
jgi:hypothetical protein